MTNTQRPAETPMATGWRIRSGAALFMLSLFGPLVLIPLVATLDLQATLIASISGGIVVGAEVLLVVAAAVMGKSGYAYVKNRAFGLLKQYGPPNEVSQARYTIGLVMFSIPILFGWLAPYLGAWLPGYEGNEFFLAIAGDLLLLVSLFVLGGDFWDKLRALFVHDAKAVFG